MGQNQELINQMQHIRAKNNSNWMDLVRLAMELDPVRTKQILQQIVDHDKNVVGILEELAK